MSEELGFYGNELVQFQTIFTVGNTVGLIPFGYIFPKVPMHWLVPTLDLGWGIFTLLQYRANSFGEIAAYRLLVALFEVCLAHFWFSRNSNYEQLIDPGPAWVSGLQYNSYYNIAHNVHGTMLTDIGILFSRRALRSRCLVSR